MFSMPTICIICYGLFLCHSTGYVNRHLISSYVFKQSRNKLGLVVLTVSIAAEHILFGKAYYTQLKVACASTAKMHQGDI